MSGIVRSLREREIRADDTDARLGWLLVVGTIPVGLIGLLAEKPLRACSRRRPARRSSCSATG